MLKIISFKSIRVSIIKKARLFLSQRNSSMFLSQRKSNCDFIGINNVYSPFDLIDELSNEIYVLTNIALNEINECVSFLKTQHQESFNFRECVDEIKTIYINYYDDINNITNSKKLGEYSDDISNEIEFFGYDMNDKIKEKKYDIIKKYPEFEKVLEFD